VNIDTPRALRMRLIVAELLARPGAGPLAPRYFERLGLLTRPRSAPPDSDAADTAPLPDER